MFLHIGNECIINTRNLIGIFDIENTSVSKITKDFLSSKKHNVITVSFDMPKSFILCFDKDFSETIYISNISASTLKKRALKGDY